MSNQTERTTPPATEAEHMAAICRAVRAFRQVQGHADAANRLREVLLADQEYGLWQEFRQAALERFNANQLRHHAADPGPIAVAKGVVA